MRRTAPCVGVRVITRNRTRSTQNNRRISELMITYYFEHNRST